MCRCSIIAGILMNIGAVSCRTLDVGIFMNVAEQRQSSGAVQSQFLLRGSEHCRNLDCVSLRKGGICSRRLRTSEEANLSLSRHPPPPKKAASPNPTERCCFLSCFCCADRVLVPGGCWRVRVLAVLLGTFSCSIPLAFWKKGTTNNIQQSS